MSRGVNLMVALVMILFQLPPSLNVSDHDGDDDEWYPLTPFPFRHPLSISLYLPFCVFSGAFVVNVLWPLLLLVVIDPAAESIPCLISLLSVCVSFPLLLGHLLHLIPWTD